MHGLKASLLALKFRPFAETLEEGGQGCTRGRAEGGTPLATLMHATSDLQRLSAIL